MTLAIIDEFTLMIISCPNCTSKFTVSSESIGSSGRKVRCTKCRHVWLQDPIAEKAYNNEIEAVLKEDSEIESESSSIASEISTAHNVETHKNKTPLYIKMALVASVVLCLFTFSIVNSSKMHPVFKSYYSALGIHDDTGISLYNISAEKIAEDSRNDLLVKGRIVNESKIDKAIPSLRIVLLGKGREKIRTVMLDSHDAALAPGEGVDFENRIPKLPENVAYVVMDIGNPVNLASR